MAKSKVKKKKAAARKVKAAERAKATKVTKDAKDANTWKGVLRLPAPMMTRLKKVVAEYNKDAEPGGKVSINSTIAQVLEAYLEYKKV